jgi:uncharacterized membrane protein
MVLNVWIRILPGQQKMLEQAKAGIEPDYSAGIKAKWRSTHNSYITLPVLFTMISNHFPMLYSNPNKWILLIFVCIAGGAFRHAMLQWNIEKSGVKSLAFSGLNIFVVFFMTIPKSNLSDSKVVTFNQIKPIIQNRCSSCHSSNPTDDIFKVAPLGLMLDQDSQIQAFAAKIYERTVTLKNMPFNNKTQMTDQERSMIESWYKSTE